MKQEAGRTVREASSSAIKVPGIPSFRAESMSSNVTDATRRARGSTV